MYGAGGGGKPGERFSFFFLRFRSLQGDCDGSSKQAFGGPQPARLSERFPYFISEWFLLGEHHGVQRSTNHLKHVGAEGDEKYVTG